jgi:two-component system, response regulator RegA
MNNKLLIVDDDQVLLERLARTLTKRQFEVTTAPSIAEAKNKISQLAFDFAVFDLKLIDGYGLDLVDLIKQRNPQVHVIILTGYGNIATAVSAIKHGAIDYLSKPADIDTIEQALRQTGHQLPPAPHNPMTPDRVRWEHIQRVFHECNQNVSETARRLQMHRRTLQRILAKHAPRN